jgi:hypothetical protein
MQVTPADKSYGETDKQSTGKLQSQHRFPPTQGNFPPATTPRCPKKRLCAVLQLSNGKVLSHVL